MNSFTERINSIRQDYRMASLNEATAGDDPVLFFRKWFEDAQQADISEVNAMTLATASKDGMPDARIVLLKGVDPDEGFVFFTNYQSNKGKELEENPVATLVFFWKELERQVRIYGKVSRTSAEESDRYFDSRPLGSRIGALASPQSRKIADRSVVEEKVKLLEAQPGTPQRPDHWGGYKVSPFKIEFWQGRSNRLHDRIVFEKNKNDGWEKYRLAP